MNGFELSLCMRSYELVGDKIESILQVYEILKESAAG